MNLDAILYGRMAKERLIDDPRYHEKIEKWRAKILRQNAHPLVAANRIRKSPRFRVLEDSLWLVAATGLLLEEMRSPVV